MQATAASSCLWAQVWGHEFSGMPEPVDSHVPVRIFDAVTFKFTRRKFRLLIL